jgi:6-phosphogluconolactonase
MIDRIIFPDADDAVAALAELIGGLASGGATAHVLLSGGSTPLKLFALLASGGYRDRIGWNNLEFWWGDERCVPPSSPESNFGQADRILFSPVGIDRARIHPIRGEVEPETEAARYAALVRDRVPPGGQTASGDRTVSGRTVSEQTVSEQTVSEQTVDALPSFDLVILGMGTDGHTASVFPGAPPPQPGSLFYPARHPENAQQRISASEQLLLAARRIIFLVTGASKAPMAARVLNGGDGAARAGAESDGDRDDRIGLPAARVAMGHPDSVFYLDAAAASLI